MPGPEPRPGPGLHSQGKAAALESLDGIKMRRPWKKSEALSRGGDSVIKESGDPETFLGSSWTRRLTGVGAEEAIRAGGDTVGWLRGGGETQNQRKSWVRGKEWCSVYSVKEASPGAVLDQEEAALAHLPRRGEAEESLKMLEVASGSHRVPPSPESHSRRKEPRKGCVGPWRKHSEIAHYS